MRKLIASILLLFTFTFAQYRPAQIIVPVSLIGAGAIVTASGLSDAVEDEMKIRRGKPYRFDDYLLYAPHVMLYGFSLFGAQAQHDYLDRTLLLGTAGIFSLSTIAVKYMVKYPRPDDDGKKTAFPSGHATLAFMGAELVRREYPAWCGALAYTLASGIGFMRVYNQRHWLGDVVAGAGFGVLSANAAYWLLPVQKKILSKKSKPETQISLYPYFNGNETGVFLTFSLK